MANNKNKIPITRVNKFFSDEDYRLEIEMGREAIEGDGNFTVVLFKVNRELTTTDDIYNEAGTDEIRFHPPIELKVEPTIEPAENQTYNSNGSLRHNEDGNLRFEIYEAQLEELGIDIDFGDYVGYAVSTTSMRYYSVANDGRKNYDNAHTIMGYKGAFRTVVCAPVDEGEFRGI